MKAMLLKLLHTVKREEKLPNSFEEIIISLLTKLE
jgi:hypothetical protein